jgi:hypothetical protein
MNKTNGELGAALLKKELIAKGYDPSDPVWDKHCAKALGVDTSTYRRWINGNASKARTNTLPKGIWEAVKKLTART